MKSQILFCQMKAAPAMEAALAEQDCEVTTVQNIYEAIIRIGGQTIDFVLLDYFVGNHTADKITDLLRKCGIPYKVMISRKDNGKPHLDDNIMILDKNFSPEKLVGMIQKEVQVHKDKTR